MLGSPQQDSLRVYKVRQGPDHRCKLHESDQGLADSLDRDLPAVDVTRLHDVVYRLP